MDIVINTQLNRQSCSARRCPAACAFSTKLAVTAAIVLACSSRTSSILPLVNRLPDGFDTTVGERGLRLSGGERQRIGRARALYGKPAILFLDEASSALDEQTKREIMDHVRGLAEEFTVIAITHRLSVVAETDKLVRVGIPETASIQSHAHTEKLLMSSSE
jgi:ABC-type bacteriocin/lantibiotic exporter with double-glycine peptidase domain